MKREYKITTKSLGGWNYDIPAIGLTGWRLGTKKDVDAYLRKTIDDLHTRGILPAPRLRRSKK